VSNSVVRTAGRVRNRRRTALVVCATLPLLAACATGFSSPTRHAVANLQAATAKLGTNLEIQGAIIALPSGSSSAKGGLAYLQFYAVNFSHEADQLIDVTVVPGSGGVASASAANPSPAASLLQPASATAIPAATASGPGTLRVSVLLRGLTAPLRQGETVSVGLKFKNSGSLSGLLVPVQSADAVGKSFLPSSPPPAPASASPSASASAVASPAASSPPASPAVGSTPASTAPSPTPAASS
jgi:hypothetical protein